MTQMERSNSIGDGSTTRGGVEMPAIPVDSKLQHCRRYTYSTVNQELLVPDKQRHNGRLNRCEIT